MIRYRVHAFLKNGEKVVREKGLLRHLFSQPLRDAAIEKARRELGLCHPYVVVKVKNSKDFIFGCKYLVRD